MNIHEYQAKQLLKKFGVPVLPGGVAYTADEAAKVAEGLGAGVYVVKAQIHAGGRGKGTFKEPDAGGKGGVRVVKSVADVKQAASQIIGKTLVTHQTGPAGKKVKRVYIESGCDIKRELYLLGEWFLIKSAPDQAALAFHAAADRCPQLSLPHVASELELKRLAQPAQPVRAIDTRR
jgi:hypothetical protein